MAIVAEVVAVELLDPFPHAEAVDQARHLVVQLVRRHPGARAQRSKPEPGELLTETLAHVALALGDRIDQHPPAAVPAAGAAHEDAALARLEQALAARRERVVAAVADLAPAQPAA